MINFKRFTATFDSIDKLLHKVNYNELLNVTSYMTSDLFTTNDKSRNINSSTNNLYKLYAVINHIGDNLNSGHYYSYIRSSDNRWFLVDDAHCQHASSNEILNHPEAFMLFYVKKVISITIGNQCSIDRIEENRQNFYHVSNKVLHPSISSKELSFISNEPSDDSIAEVSDGEETQMETCKKLASVAAGVRIEQVFEETLSQTHHFRLTEIELLKMNQY
ncbi:unnamed protein product [Rotaria magnacalcarata]|uniref:USP domain-containing protein n=1 Tax=Rotaria magnacalcarata TaxID=392030 RepID=A0A816RH37_9BILA|nr:unnamed protein product [Rotaria magnacalcarata]